ncbi:MAG: hypothetical protein ABR529_14140 [Actinomycetota bacterium]
MRVLAISIAMVAVVAGACGGSSAGPANPNTVEHNPPGDIPDDQVFVTYTAPSKTFSVRVPEGWAQSSQQEATTFTDKLNSITIESHQSTHAPTLKSATTEDLPRLKTQVPNFAPGDVTLLHRPAGDAVLITYEGDSARDSVTGKVIRDAIQRFEFFHNGNEVVLTLSDPKGADNVDPWNIVTGSLKWLP